MVLILFPTCLNHLSISFAGVLGEHPLSVLQFSMPGKLENVASGDTLAVLARREYPHFSFFPLFKFIKRSYSSPRMFIICS